MTIYIYYLPNKTILIVKYYKLYYYLTWNNLIFNFSWFFKRNPAKLYFELMCFIIHLYSNGTSDIGSFFVQRYPLFTLERGIHWSGAGESNVYPPRPLWTIVIMCLIFQEWHAPCTYKKIIWRSSWWATTSLSCFAIWSVFPVWSIYSGSDHVCWLVGSSDTILKVHALRMIQGKFGSYWPIGSRG